MDSVGYNIGFAIGQFVAAVLGTVGLPVLILWFVRSVYLGFRQRHTLRILLGVIAILVCAFFWLAYQVAHTA